LYQNLDLPKILYPLLVENYNIKIHPFKLLIIELNQYLDMDKKQLNLHNLLLSKIIKDHILLFGYATNTIRVAKKETKK